MSVTDKNIHKDAVVAQKQFVATKETVGASLTDEFLGRRKPGHAFEIVGVQVSASAVTGTASVEVKVGNATDGRATVLTGPITPVADDVAEGTLVAGITDRRGRTDDDITVELTTAGASSITDLIVTVLYRKNPLAGEASYRT